MKLPNDAIGISDILTYRDCPQRFEFQMRRWTEGADPPEDQHPDTMYGKIVHFCLKLIEDEDLTDDEAVQRAFDDYGKWLDPEDDPKLRADFETYRARDTLGVRTLAAEMDVRVPLLEHGGKTIYFRGQIDRLYQRLDNPAVFIHRDYKSSKWPKSEEEVHSDLQMWGYNCLIYEFWPEVDSLTQVYDQLRAGEIPTRKSALQRAKMWAWIQKQVRAILADETLSPTTNQWCPWCPIMESCTEVRRLADWSLAKIAALSTNVEKPDELHLDPDLIDQYVADLELISRSRKMAERYEDEVRKVLKKMPQARREKLGYEVKSRSKTVWQPDALPHVQERVGDDLFYSLISMTQTRLRKLVTDAAMREEIEQMAVKTEGATVLVQIN